MKNYLKDLLKRLAEKKANLIERSNKSEDLNEVRSISTELESVNSEIAQAQSKLAELEADEARNAEEENKEARGFDPMKVVGGAAQVVPGAEARGNEDPRSTMEYRTAFMNYVQRGEINRDVLQFEQRTDASGTASNLGVLIPMTVIQSIIQGIEKVYGQLYSRVRKLNVKGGVKFPIGSFTATFNRIAENGKSDRQNPGGVTGSVEFSYKIGEIRLAKSLLQSVLSVPVFEEEFAKTIVKAYVEAMDKEIMTGTDANNQCVGILSTDGLARIPAANIISFTAAEMADWTKWQEKLFAKIPLSMRGLKPEFAMTANTYESNIKTLKDNNNRPLYNETFNPVDGSEICTFKGKQVCLVEEDILKNFNDAVNNEYFGMYWVPNEAYGINTNMEFIIIDYFDQELNQFVKKALVINDGKILDPKYIYLLKKSVQG